ncbi:MAG: hypothetical protein HKN67_09225, partial [Saprospiraceae bacterium]|nr:hypothetical protein [Saprospiraceae bacterium]
MRYFLFLGLLFHFIELGGQNNLSLNLQTSAGFEHNVFNRSGDAELRNSPFIQNKFKLSWKRKFNDSSFSTYVKGRHEVFHLINTANLRNLSLYSSYRKNLGRKVYFFIKATVWLNDSNRTMEDAEFNLTTTSYNKWNTRFGLTTRVIKQHKTSVSMYVADKNYTSEKARFHKYRELGFKLQNRLKLMKNKTLSQYLNSEFRIYQRRYQENITGDYKGSETADTDTRIFRFMVLELSYHIKIKRRFGLSPSILFRKRTDVIENRFSYTHWEPRMEFSGMIGKLELSLRLSQGWRTFKNIFSETQTTRQLQLEYLKLNCLIRYQINNSIEIKLNGYWQQRKRNVFDPSPS